MSEKYFMNWAKVLNFCWAVIFRMISDMLSAFVWWQNSSAKMPKHFEVCETFTWRRHQMDTLSALLAICAGNSPVPGEVPAQRPVTRSFDVFFDLRVNKRLSKQWWGWWFETPSRPLWRHRNVKGDATFKHNWYFASLIGVLAVMLSMTKALCARCWCLVINNGDKSWHSPWNCSLIQFFLNAVLAYMSNCTQKGSSGRRS